MQVLSDAGEELIKAFEGLEKLTHDGRVTTYYDSVHVLTIGWGHTNYGNIPPHIYPGMILTVEECERAFQADMLKFEVDVSRILSGVALKQYQFDALVSLDFNTGALGRSSIPGKIRRNDFKAAMDTLELYDHAGGKRLKGLTRRRHAERLMFEGKVIESLTLAGVHVTSSDIMSKGAPQHFNGGNT